MENYERHDSTKDSDLDVGCYDLSLPPFTTFVYCCRDVCWTGLNGFRQENVEWMQILIWDLERKTEKRELAVDRSAQPVKHRYASALEFSHECSVTDLKWLPNKEITKTGALTSLEVTKPSLSGLEFVLV